MPKYSVVAADLSRDRGVISELWKRNLSSSENLEEKFDWHFLRNPYGQGRCWLLLADGREVGTASLGIRPVKAGNKVISAGVACDLCVDRQHRVLLPALLLQKAVVTAISDEIPVIYGLPNASGAAPILRAGYKQAGFVHRFAKVLRVTEYLESLSKLRALTRLGGGILNPACATLDWMRARTGRDHAMETLPEFDSRFDELWDRSKDEHEVIGVRDRRFLRWRYQECPLQTYTTLGLLSRDRARLSAYLIFYMLGDRMMCTDVFAGRNPEYFFALLASAVVYARRRGAVSMSIHCAVPAAFIASLQRLGFRRRTVESKQAGTSEQGRILLAHTGASSQFSLNRPWYFTPGDEPYN